jgi:predicted TPR repeat methyltransferase
VYDEIVVDRCHHRWAAHLDELWSTDAADVRTVLDLCCGTGLMAAELIALGYRVVGVDRSSAMLARARQRVGPATVLTQQTLPGLTIDGVFDAAVCTFDALNYLTPADLGGTLTEVGRRLRPGGWFVFDLHTHAMMDFTLSHPVVEGEAVGYRFALDTVVDVSARTCDTRIDVTRAHDGDTFSERHRQYFHGDAEVREALTDAGFTVAALTDEYTHQRAHSSTLRATWTARYLAARPPPAAFGSPETRPGSGAGVQ